jgi:hypothetical protein
MIWPITARILRRETLGVNQSPQVVVFSSRRDLEWNSPLFTDASLYLADSRQAFPNLVPSELPVIR